MTGKTEWLHALCAKPTGSSGICFVRGNQERNSLSDVRILRGIGIMIMILLYGKWPAWELGVTALGNLSSSNLFLTSSVSSKRELNYLICLVLSFFADFVATISGPYCRCRFDLVLSISKWWSCWWVSKSLAPVFCFEAAILFAVRTLDLDRASLCVVVIFADENREVNRIDCCRRNHALVTATIHCAYSRSIVVRYECLTPKSSSGRMGRTWDYFVNEELSLRTCISLRWHRSMARGIKSHVFRVRSHDILVPYSIAEIVLDQSSFGFLCFWILGWWIRGVLKLMVEDSQFFNVSIIGSLRKLSKPIISD